MKLTPSSQSPSDQTPLYFTGETDAPPLLPRKIWNEFYQSLISNHGKTLIWAFLTFFLSGILLSVDYWVPSQIVENEISTQDVYAPYTIEVKDVEETLGAQKQARKDTLPVYKSVQSINQSVREVIGETFQGIQELKQNTRKSYAEKRAEFIALIGQVDGADAMADTVLQNITVSQLESIQHLTQITAEHLLQEGLSENDYVERRSLVIMKAMPQAGYSPIEIEVAQFFTHLMIKPNLYIDNEAWSKAKEDAAKKVKPFYKTFRKGQKIVGRGEMVTPLKNQALSEIGKTPKGINFTGALGVLLLTLIFTGTLWGYLYNYESRDYFKPQFSSLLCTLTVSSLFMVKLAQQNEWPLLAIPLACYALLVSIFTHPRIGLLASTLLVFLLALTLKMDFSILAVLLFGSVVGVYVLSRRLNFNDRAQLMFAGFYVGLTNGIVLLAVELLGANPFLTDWQEMSTAMLWTVLVSGIGSGILTFGILPYLESLFRLITPFTLMELGNHDKPLLKRMQFEAPGTFHHSLMVATLCEAAAEAIGANALLARVGSLYHDIGKMKRPLFFIENQAYFGVENPHDRLTPRLSKMVVTAHPRDSVEMARQYQLPDVLTKFMTEHHGTLVAGYFYNQACIQEGEENVNKSQFRYPGPKPNIKETAICMMADACESAVRALKNPTPNQIEERIDKIIKQRVDDGQFENCPITFKDIQVVRDTFVRVIRGFQHQRIEYQQNVIRELGRKIQMTDPSSTKSSVQSSSKNPASSSTMAASGGTGIIDPGHSGSPISHDPEDPSNDCC